MITEQIARQEFTDANFCRVAVKAGWSLQEARGIWALRDDAAFFEAALNAASLAGEPLAVGRLARSYPKEHRAWLTWTNSGAPSLRLAPTTAESFASLVSALVKKGVAVRAAVKRLAKQHPAAYRAWRDAGAV